MLKLCEHHMCMAPHGFRIPWPFPLMPYWVRQPSQTQINLNSFQSAGCKTHLHEHPDGADDEGEEGARPVELVDDLGAVDVEGGSVVEVRLVDALEVGDENEAGGGEGAQQQRAPVQQAQDPANDSNPFLSGVMTVQ